MQAEKLLVLLFVSVTTAERLNLPDGVSQPVTPYDFGYGVSVPDTGDAKEHKQSVSPSGHTEGEYRVLQPNGLYRVTRYRVHGGSGFRATVSLEPGNHVTNYKYDRFAQSNTTPTASSTSFTSAGRRHPGTQNHPSGQLSTHSPTHVPQLQGRRVSEFISDRSQTTQTRASVSTQKTISREPHSQETNSQENHSQKFPGRQVSPGQASHGSQMSYGRTSQIQISRGSQKAHDQTFHASQSSHGQISQSSQKFHGSVSQNFQRSHGQVPHSSQGFNGQVSRNSRGFHGQIPQNFRSSHGQITLGSLRSKDQVSYGPQRFHSHVSHGFQRSPSQSFNRFSNQNSHASQRFQNKGLHGLQNPNFPSFQKLSHDSLRQDFHSLQNLQSQGTHRTPSQASQSRQRSHNFPNSQSSGAPILQKFSNQHIQDSRESHSQSFHRSRSQSPLVSHSENVFDSQESHSQGSLNFHNRVLSDPRLLERVHELGFLGSLNTRTQIVDTQGQVIDIPKTKNERIGNQAVQDKKIDFQRADSQGINTNDQRRVFPTLTTEDQRHSSQKTLNLRGDTQQTNYQKSGIQRTLGLTTGSQLNQNRRSGIQRVRGRGFGKQAVGNRGFATQNFHRGDSHRNNDYVLNTQRIQHQRFGVQVPVQHAVIQKFPLPSTQGHFLGGSQLKNKNVATQNVLYRDLLDSDESLSSQESSSQQSQDDDFSSQEASSEEASIEGFEDEDINLNLQSKDLSNHRLENEGQSTEDFVDGDISIQKLQGKHIGTQHFGIQTQVSPQLKEVKLNIKQHHNQGFRTNQFRGENTSNQQANDENISTRRLQNDEVIIQQFKQQEFGVRQLTSLKDALPKIPGSFSIQQHHGQNVKALETPQIHDFRSQQFEATQIQDQQFGANESQHQELRVQSTAHHQEDNFHPGLGNRHGSARSNARSFDHPGGQGSPGFSSSSHGLHKDQFDEKTHDGEKNIGVSLFDVQNFASSSARDKQPKARVQQPHPLEQQSAVLTPSFRGRVSVVLD